MGGSAARDKAKLLLARRAAPPGVGYYLRQRWPQQVLIAAAYLGVIAALWALRQPSLALAVGGYFVGRTVRDFQWWRVLAREWPSTREWLDWEKIQRAADERGN